VIMNDFCLSSATFCYVIVNVWNLESLRHIWNRRVPWKVASGAENPVLHSLQFQLMAFRHKFPDGTGTNHCRLTSALWRVNLILVLNLPLLNREYNIINVLKVLASILSVCSLNVILLSKMTAR
jgi:hypothetical protein